ncbi:MAG: hypothetical protein JOZ10_03460 [Acidobacteria bacterium]|nr:hypothetical protein [Acidobacteriota bacterium]
MRLCFQFLALLILLSPCGLAADSPILPKGFAGWQQDTVSVKTSHNPADADASNAAVLKEYGLTDFESVNYRKDGDRKLSVRAIRFQDATGAYGAYSLYSQPGMQTEEIGRHGESADDRVLFMQGNVVVEAKFDQVNAMSAAEMRELAGDLPEPPGALGQPPNIARWLPQPAFIEHSVKYAVGPKSYDMTGAPLPGSTLDFSKSPEILTALYKSDEGNARLTLIAYPTPQIAGAQLRTIEQNRAALQASGAGDFQVKRTGPLLAIVSGDASSSEAKSLLASVNYEANVTYDEPTFLGKKNNIGNLIVAVFGLIGLILAVAVVLGVSFGGVRILLKRFYPDRFIDRPEDNAVITLNLRDESPKST